MADARLLFCAPRSGSGKTTVVCAVLQALADRGARPVAFKCGPDYIDPMFHSEVIGAPSRSMDLFFLGGDKARYLMGRQLAGAGVGIVEGAMGYYDGISMSSEASAYDLARETETPAVLIVDGRSCALSLAAQVKGFMSFRADSGIKGVIINRVTPMLYPRLKETVERECGVRVYGFMPECGEASLESRHLGLVTAAEVENLRAKMRALAALAAEHIELGALMELAASAPALRADEPRLPQPLGRKVRIAVARDRAFCFYYADSLELLERLGAEIEYFSPLTDSSLPEGCCGLYLGGGYPELYARTLSENTAMLAAVRAAVTGGMPTIAECGGFMYLHRSIESPSGAEFPMAGVLDARAFRTDRLRRFGYIRLTARTSGLLMPAGGELPAHEFHYWDSTEPGADMRARKPQSDRGWDCAVHTGTMYAGFPHFNFWSAPDAAKRFLDSCDRFGRKEQCN